MTTQAIITSLFTTVFIVGICWGIFKSSNSDHKSKTQYDERQQVLRGRGYMIGFWTVLVYQTVLYVLECAGATLPVAPFSLGFLGAILAVTVMCVYDIWVGAYWGLNNDRKRYLIILGVFGVFSLIPVVAAAKMGFVEHILQGPVLVNLGIGVMLITMFVTLLIRHIADKKEEDA